jgi:Spy/CpxP family protein refolding chaperone
MADALPGRPSKGIFAVALVFALGVVFGAALSVVLLRLHGGFQLPIGPRGGPHFGRGPIGRMVRELDLDADQRRRIVAIIERSHGSIQQTLDETHREIRAILRPDQQQRFDRMRPPRMPMPHGGPPPPGDDGPPPPPNP